MLTSTKGVHETARRRHDPHLSRLRVWPSTLQVRPRWILCRIQGDCVLSVDFKKGELEIGIVGGPRTDGKEGTDSTFRALTEEEIDERLNAIAEKD